MSGKFIVFEGMDCSGKTTIIDHLLVQMPNSVYCKGIGKKDFIGDLARLFHVTLTFCLELLFRTYVNIIPNLKKDKIVLQDRYFASVSTYLPKTGIFYNKFILKIVKTFLVEPDIVIYLTLPLNERMKRLKEKGTDYELHLAKNPNLIKLRENAYRKWFDELKCPKMIIDTYYNNLDESLLLINEFIISFQPIN